MNCLNAENHFSAYLEDELDYRKICAFETHLNDCESCQYGFDVFRRSLELLHHLPQLEPSYEFNHETQDYIDNLEVANDRLGHAFVQFLRSRTAWAISSIGTIIIVLMVLIAAFVYQTPTKSSRVLRPSIILDTSGAAALEWKDPWDSASPIMHPVPRVNPSLAMEDFTLDEFEILENTQEERRTEQIYILQTIDYSAPRTGGL